MRVEPVTGHISLVHGEKDGVFPGSHSILILGEETVLIDTGCGIKDLKQLRDEYDVSYVINSHTHPDHSAGNWVFGDRPIHVPEEGFDTSGDDIALARRFLGREVSAVFRDFMKKAMGFRNCRPTDPTRKKSKSFTLRISVSAGGGPIDGPGGDGVIDIIHPPADYDPVRAEAARMIADQLNEIGIEATNIPLDFGSLVQRTNNHDFEMYLLGWSIGGDDAGYLWDFFRSDARDTIGGYNSPGYRNESYDAIVDQMIEELNVDDRISLAKQAQAAIAEDLVYNILYYRDNIEAYRTSVFPAGWWAQTGGLFNQWTLMGLKTTPDIKYGVTIDGPSKLNADSQFTVTVLDEDGAPIQGAEVVIDVGYGVATPESGVTGSNGKMTFTFAPDQVSNVVAQIKAYVTYEDTDKIGSMSITIMGEGDFWIQSSSELDIATPVDFDNAKLGIPFEVRAKDPNDG